MANVDLDALLARLLRAPDALIADERAARSIGDEAMVARAEIATLRAEVARVQAVVRALMPVLLDLGARREDIVRRLRNARHASDHDDDDAGEPIAAPGTPYRGGGATISASACARCATPLEGESAAFVPGVGSVCTGCYRVSDGR